MYWLHCFFFFIEIHNFCLLTRHETLSALLDFSKGKGVIPVICSNIPSTVHKLFMDSMFVDRLPRYSFFWANNGDDAVPLVIQV